MTQLRDEVTRPVGCLCTWEEGDSDCPVHPTCEECGLPTKPENMCECNHVRDSAWWGELLSTVKPAPIITLPNVPETCVRVVKLGVVVSRGAWMSSGFTTLYRSTVVFARDWT